MCWVYFLSPVVFEPWVHACSTQLALKLVKQLLSLLVVVADLLLFTFVASQHRAILYSTFCSAFATGIWLVLSDRGSTSAVLAVLTENPCSQVLSCTFPHNTLWIGYRCLAHGKQVDTRVIPIQALCSQARSFLWIVIPLLFHHLGIPAPPRNTYLPEVHISQTTSRFLQDIRINLAVVISIKFFSRCFMSFRIKWRGQIKVPSCCATWVSCHTFPAGSTFQKANNHLYTSLCVPTVLNKDYIYTVHQVDRSKELEALTPVYLLNEDKLFFVLEVSYSLHAFAFLSPVFN